MTWTKSDIRAARRKPLAPILQARGLQLKPLSAGNFLVIEHDDLVVKECYWRWPSRNIDGNAIDYFMRVEGKTFNQAMRLLCDTPSQVQVLAAPQNPLDPPQADKKRSELPSYASSPKP